MGRRREEGGRRDVPRPFAEGTRIMFGAVFDALEGHLARPGLCGDGGEVSRGGAEGVRPVVLSRVILSSETQNKTV